MSADHPARKASRRGKTASVETKTIDSASPSSPNESASPVGSSLAGRLTGLPGAVADTVTGALRKVARTAETPLRVGKALLLTPDQAAAMQEAGSYLRDLRLVAGLTLDDLNAALELKDHSLLAAVEKGTAALSFDLILRLTALLARRDPIPVALRLARAYRPDLWRILEDWGIGRLSLQFERERQFLNLYRRRDDARELSDAGFAEVLRFTQNAFEMALRFVAAQEGRNPAADETSAES